ncbi:MAG: heme o synthase [Acidobacteriota bacterium]
MTSDAQLIARSRASDFLELAKPRITLLVVLTTAVGFAVASSGPFPLLRFLHTLVGTALVAGGASALNQVWERDLDARMRRTERRPLPSGRLSVDLGLLFGVGLAIVGMAELAVFVNLLTALLGGLTLAGYVFLYTPLKQVTSLSTVIGAVPGAVPPMMGWTAVRDSIGPEAWILFGILFLWQMPHFLAIAWMFREDYARGGYPMLPVIDPSGVSTARQAVLYCAALLPVSLLPSVFGFAGPIYFGAALVLGVVLLGYCWEFSRSLTHTSARKLMMASVLYLPAVLLLLVVDRATR